MLAFQVYRKWLCKANNFRTLIIANRPFLGPDAVEAEHPPQRERDASTSGIHIVS